ncbi:hypothetical protein TEA_013614 [Camellia sinensis var. sinensis]|uniref:Ionotropic glutamate receptor C-terminal domain-containing protein n=1 Tax=Camellia sinensis var. sinensis TaxID=542762 RepID=A0A4S4DNV9_CAMSN|nr:hypothetical protein TEA_013614 [Camellia sinensis var. sinensis]
MLDYVNASVISSMEGVIGIKTYFVKDKRPFISFNRHFKEIFQSKYPEEYNFEPGIHAIRAFDSIIVITNALNSIRGNNRSPSMLLKSILLSNFTSLSGRIHFQSRQLWQSPLFSIVNVIGKSYKELGFWSSKFGFTENNKSINDDGSDDNMEALEDLVTWTGNLKHTPKGRVMLTNTEAMRIGVPSKTAFEKFVKVEAISNSTEKRYSGFCIDVFEEVLKIVQKKYPIRVDYFPYDGTYEGLIDEVFYKLYVVDYVWNGTILKTFDAAIGDITILANRSKYVEFTQPFIESRLTMIVTAKPEAQKAWMFLRPFTKEMWVFTSAILFYTVFIVWLLERQSNPEFEGPWRNQLATALWFTYSSLFFTQRERVHSNYTRVVVLVWLFVVLALNSSYTANLSSMLTVSRLESSVTNVEWLRRNNAKVGCDADSFIGDYLVNNLKFKMDNLKKIHSEYDYPSELQTSNITAAFLELPYEKAFLLENCNGYIATELPDRFGGFGFIPYATKQTNTD